MSASEPGCHDASWGRRVRGAMAVLAVGLVVSTMLAPDSAVRAEDPVQAGETAKQAPRAPTGGNAEKVEESQPTGPGSQGVGSPPVQGVPPVDEPSIAPIAASVEELRAELAKVRQMVEANQTRLEELAATLPKVIEALERVGGRSEASPDSEAPPGGSATADGIPAQGSGMPWWLVVILAIIGATVLAVAWAYFEYRRSRGVGDRRRAPDATPATPAFTGVERELQALSSRLDRSTHFLVDLASNVERTWERVVAMERSVSKALDREAPPSGEGRAPTAAEEAVRVQAADLARSDASDGSAWEDQQPPHAGVSVEPAATRDRLCVDFNRLLARDGDPRDFVREWGPKPVVLSNFEERLREPSVMPRLTLKHDSRGSQKEQFWLISTDSEHEGWLLPAHRLFTRRASLQGEAAATLFESIFHRSPSGAFSVKSPARAKVERSDVLVTEMGALATP